MPSSTSVPLPVAYEPFAYAPGSLESQSGGSGWGAGWTNVVDPPNDTAVQEGGLVAPTGRLATAGNAMHTNPTVDRGRARRALREPLGAAGTSMWVSFLIRPDSSNDYYGGLTLGGDEPMGHGGVFIGGSTTSGRWGLNTSGDRPGQKATAADSAVAVGRTAFLVVRVDFADGPDTVTLYVDPTPGKAAPDSAAGLRALKNDIDLGTFKYLTISSGHVARYSLDEIRVGESYTAVAPAR
jgi:hypothetical protein